MVRWPVATIPSESWPTHPRRIPVLDLLGLPGDGGNVVYRWTDCNGQRYESTHHPSEWQTGEDALWVCQIPDHCTIHAASE
jgi:hypothetical protein